MGALSLKCSNTKKEYPAKWPAKRECLVNSKVGIAIYQLKALFNANYYLTKHFKFIKGLVHNLQTTGGHTLVQ